MKTILMVFALVITLSITGSASNVLSVVKSQTESTSVSKMNSSSLMKSGKSKKSHHKKHKRGSGSKKTK
jgi:hypothetical protein